jgi:hypothetical protein
MTDMDFAMKEKGEKEGGEDESEILAAVRRSLNDSKNAIITYHLLN